MNFDKCLNQPIVCQGLGNKRISPRSQSFNLRSKERSKIRVSVVDSAKERKSREGPPGLSEETTVLRVWPPFPQDDA